MNYFIIAGNPPARHFYELWRDEILVEAAGRNGAQSAPEIYISTYPQLSLHQDSHRYLQLVAESHIEQLVQFRAGAAGPVALIGHSLGGWMALRVLERCASDIEACFLLQPFLTRPTWQARALLNVARRLHGPRRWVEKVLLQARPALEKYWSDLRHVTDDELRVALNLAYHEHVVLGQAKKAFSLDGLAKDKIKLISSPRDIWCPPYAARALKSHVQHIGEMASHGFITLPNERAQVWRAIQKTLSV